MFKNLRLHTNASNAFTTKQKQSSNNMLPHPIQNALKRASILIICLFATLNTASAQNNSISGFIYMGEFEGSSYYCSYYNYNWNQAQALVAQHGGHMLTINSWEENAYVSARIMGNVAWLGYSNYNSNNWQWINGQDSDVSNWSWGEPNGSGHGAVIKRHSGVWKDRYHGNKYEVVMEIPNCTSTLDICNDGDCPVNLYHWVPSGDIFLTTLEPGQCHETESTSGEMYRIVDTNNNWNNLIIDEHYTVAECEDQTWTVSPCPSDDSCPADCPVPNLSDADYLGTFNGSRYYRRANDCITYWQAYDYAQSVGGHLLTINSEAEDNFIASVTEGPLWIGLTDADSEGNFVWNTGEPLTYTNWKSGQPNDYYNNQDYTVIYNGQWYDIDEYYHAWSIVEIPCDCCTATLDICNDGGCPVNLYHWVATGDVFLTTLDPGQCYEVESSPRAMYRIVDTNNDWNNLIIDEHYTVEGCEDQTWVVNPCPSDGSCPADCDIPNLNGADYLGTFNGNRYYRRGNDCINYWQAYNYAQSVGGHMLTITSEAEDDFIASVTEGPIWIGLTDTDSEGNFMWNTGEPLTYTNWKPGQPNDYYNNQDYTVIYNDQWYDIDPYYHAWSIVEVPCDCRTPTVTICNEGTCPAGVYQQQSTGDIFITELTSDECIEIPSQEGDTYYVSNQQVETNTAEEEFSCTTSPIVHWDLDACTAYSNDGTNMDYSEFTPSYPSDGGCLATSGVTASNLYRGNGAMHSCAYPRAGQGGEAICVASSSSSQYQTNDPLAVNFDVTINPDEIGSIATFQFWETGPQQYSWIDGASGTNNYPTKYGIRVLKNGIEIFRSENNQTSRNWTLQTFDFSNNPAFQVTSITTFTFELFPYDLVGNGSPVAAWELDDITILGCCGASNTSQTEEPAPILDEYNSYTVNSCEDQVWGTQPICPSDDSCPEECPIGNFTDADYIGTLNGSRYYIKSGGNVNYQDAVIFAESLGGHLITINDAAENEFLKNVTGGSVWLGLSDARSEGSFEWTTGEPLEYTNWNNGEPNDWGNGEDYTQFYDNGKWNDIDENAQLICVVEIPCDCCTPTLTICNAGICNAGLYQQQSTGDIFITDLPPGGCFEVISEEGSTYYVMPQQGGPPGIIEQYDSYTVNGCEDQIWGAQPTCPLPLFCFAEILSEISLPGGTDGSIIIEADGGIPPFKYIWSTGDTTQVLEGLGAGTYLVRIGDASGAACMAEITLEDPAIIGDITDGDGSRNIVSSSINTQELLVTPIELLDFAVRAIDDNQIQIDWATLNEHENQKFVLERSLNGTDFHAISTIDGKGDISNVTPYGHIDQRPSLGRNYYRIKKVYFNGYFEYTAIKSAVIKGDSQKEVFVYPNPTPDVLTIRSADAFKQTVIVKVLNHQGMQLLEYSIPSGKHTESIDLSNYAPGIYHVHLIYEKEKDITFKVIKIDY